MQRAGNDIAQVVRDVATQRVLDGVPFQSPTPSRMQVSQIGAGGDRIRAGLEGHPFQLNHHFLELLKLGKLRLHPLQDELVHLDHMGVIV